MCSVQFSMALLVFSREIILESTAKHHVKYRYGILRRSEKVKSGRASRKYIEAKRRCYQYSFT